MKKLKTFIFTLSALFVLACGYNVYDVYVAYATEGTVADPVVHQQSATRTGLVGYWSMDSNDINGTTVYDKSGWKNNAVSTGGPTVAAGKINQAISLNSTTQYLDAGNSASLNLTNNFSISTWVKTNAIGAVQIIVAKSAGNYTESQYEVRLTATGVPELIATNGTGVFSGTDNTPLIPNTWYHLVGVMDNKVMKVYINSRVGSAPATLTGTQSTTAEDVFIGKGGNLYGTGNYFNGLIDDVRIYNKALSAQEIQNIYSAAKIRHIQ